MQQKDGSGADGAGIELDGVVGSELDVGDQAHAQDVELPLGSGSQDGAPVPGIAQAHALDEGGGAHSPAGELQLAAHGAGDEAHGSRQVNGLQTLQQPVCRLGTRIEVDRAVGPLESQCRTEELTPAGQDPVQEHLGSRARLNDLAVAPQ